MFSDESNIQNNQILLTTIVDALVTEKFLTYEQGENFKLKYGVIAVKPKMFTNIFKKLFTNETYKDESFYYKVVKFVGDVNLTGDISVITDINELKNLLSKATNDEDYKLANRISLRIKKLEENKK